MATFPERFAPDLFPTPAGSDARGRWFEGLRFLIRQTRIMTSILKHPQVPWHAKLVAGCTVGYLLSPIQLIPTPIPVIGQLDDLAVLIVGMKLVRILTPAALLEECSSSG